MVLPTVAENLADELQGVGLVVYQVSEEAPNDPSQLKIIYSNRAADGITGLSFKELWGKTLGETFPVFIQTGIPRRFLEGYHRGEAVNTGEVPYQDERISSNIFQSSSVPLSGGRILVQFVSVKENYQKQIEMLRQAENTKNTFVATISHEIRTPLNGIVNMSEWLLRTPVEKRTEASLQSRVRILNRCSLQLLELINDILDFSRLRGGTLKLIHDSFSLSQCIDEIWDMHSLDAQQKKLEYHYEIQSSLPDKFMGDEKRIRQVLNNLVTNAVKFTDRGYIRLNVEGQGNDGQWSIRFSLADTGCGIPDDKREEVMRPFVQLGSSPGERSGTGLGLAISSELISLMGGSIYNRDNPPRGTVFVMELSLSSTDYVDNLVKAHGEELRGLNIIAVDDRTEVRLQLAQFFFEWGMTHQICSTADEVQLYFASYPPNHFQICVLDIDLGHRSTSGVELAQHIKQEYYDLPLVALSSVGLDFPGHELFDVCKEKPIDKTQLLDSIIRALHHHQSSPPQTVPSAIHNNNNLLIRDRSDMRILVAEDDMNNQQTFMLLLEELGYNKVHLVDNGEEVLKALAANPRYHCVLLDSKMPKMTGIEAAQAIKQNRAKYGNPVLVTVTAGTLEADRVRSIQAGIQFFVMKPIQIRQMEQTLDIIAKSFLVRIDGPTVDAASSSAGGPGVL